MTTPSGRICNDLERKRERRKKEKMPFIVATYVYASTQGQRTHSARTKNDGCIKVTEQNYADALMLL